ncbi:organic solute transporter subunit alpha-like [Branchiostoma lanceolatum]|uniref:organic solute transporter subunit alpha-like n=1 Tax=Branchiostoma lanceolatum TaxID=7740 RepID=UPI003455A263
MTLNTLIMTRNHSAQEMPLNCTARLPHFADRVEQVSTDVTAVVVMFGGTLASLITVLLYLEECLYFCRNPFTARRRSKMLKILAVYPVISTTATSSLWFPQACAVADFAASWYLSLAIYQVFTLMVDYLGGKRGIVESIGGLKIRMNTLPICCCVCIHPKPLNMVLLRRFHLGVLQLTVVYPVTTYVSTLISTDRSGQGSNQDTASADLVLRVVPLVSVLMAVYSITCVCRNVTTHMPHASAFRLRPKLAVVMFIMGLTRLQSLVLSLVRIPGGKGCGPGTIFTGPDRRKVIGSVLTVLEMLLLGLLARRLFTQPVEDDLEDPCDVTDQHFHEKRVMIVRTTSL